MNGFKSEANEIKGRMIGYIGAALGVVAGLAWNEAITSLINLIFPLDKNSVLAKFIYAVIITIFVVLLIQRLEKFLDKKSS